MWFSVISRKRSRQICGAGVAIVAVIVAVVGSIRRIVVTCGKCEYAEAHDENEQQTNDSVFHISPFLFAEIVFFLPAPYGTGERAVASWSAAAFP